MDEPLIQPVSSEPVRKRNPGWTRDEIIIALDLFFRVNYRAISKKHPEILYFS